MLAGPGMGGGPPVAVLNPTFSGGPDSIEYAVSRMKGKTLIANSSEDFAKAVAEVRRLMGEGK